MLSMNIRKGERKREKPIKECTLKESIITTRPTSFYWNSCVI